MSTKTKPTKLTAPQRKRLAALEGLVRQGLDSVVEMGRALAEIRDKRLYRETHRSFDVYCRERWGVAHHTARGYIEHAEVTRKVGTSLPSLSVGVAHVLAPLTRDEQKKLGPVVAKLPVREARRRIRDYRDGLLSLDEALHAEAKAAVDGAEPVVSPNVDDAIDRFERARDILARFTPALEGATLTDEQRKRLDATVGGIRALLDKVGA